VARLCTSLLAAAMLLGSPAALGGFYEDLYQGLGYLATPSGSPVTGVVGGGQANGNRFGRLRIVPNEFGEGYRLEFDRTFGLDTRGRPEVFDIGSLELELSGATAATIQYTGRGIRTVNADIFANNLNYLLRDKTGVQDFELSGTLSVNHQLEVSRLGFYYLDLEINNINSSLVADGLVVEGPTDADFDIGPISVRGNVFVDAAAAVLNAFGVDAGPLENLFPASPIEVINDEIEAFVDRHLILGETFAADLVGGELGADSALGFLSGPLPPLDAAAAFDSPASGVPESSTLLLVGSLALIGLRRRM
jgi:hypothetical protein